MISPSIGFTPAFAPIILSQGADFNFSLSIDPAVFPSGTNVWIAWSNQANSIWTAVVSGGTASWLRQSTETTAAVIPFGTAYHLYVSYPGGASTLDYLWYYGWARRTE